MSCGTKRNHYYDEIAKAGSPIARRLGGAGGSAEQANAALTEVFDIGRNRRDVSAEQARKDTAALFHEMDALGIGWPVHLSENEVKRLKRAGKVPLPKGDAIYGYSQLYRTIAACRRGQPLPELAQAIVTRNAAQAQASGVPAPGNGRARGQAAGAAPRAAIAAAAAPDRIASVARIDPGKMQYRCVSCGRFISLAKTHLCPNTLSAQALGRAVGRRLGLPAEAYQDPDGKLHALLSKARAGEVVLRHTLTGQTVTTDLDGLALALAQGYRPDDWRGLPLARTANGLLVPVTNPAGAGKRLVDPHELGASVRQEVRAYALAAAACGLAVDENDLVHGLLGVGQLRPQGVAPEAAGAEEDEAVPGTARLEGGEEYDWGRFYGTEYRNRKDGPFEGDEVLVAGLPLRRGMLIKPATRPEDFSTARRLGLTWPYQRDEVTVGRTLPRAIDILASARIVDRGDGVVEVYDARGRLLSAYDGVEDTAGDTRGSGNASPESVAAYLAYYSLHPGDDAYAMAMAADVARARTAPLAALDSATAFMFGSAFQEDRHPRFGARVAADRAGAARPAAAVAAQAPARAEVEPELFDDVDRAAAQQIAGDPALLGAVNAYRATTAPTQAGAEAVAAGREQEWLAQVGAINAVVAATGTPAAANAGQVGALEAARAVLDGTGQARCAACGAYTSPDGPCQACGGTGKAPAPAPAPALAASARPAPGIPRAAMPGAPARAMPISAPDAAAATELKVTPSLVLLTQGAPRPLTRNEEDSLGRIWEAIETARRTGREVDPVLAKAARRFAQATHGTPTYQATGRDLAKQLIAARNRVLRRQGQPVPPVWIPGPAGPVRVGRAVFGPTYGARAGGAAVEELGGTGLSASAGPRMERAGGRQKAAPPAPAETGAATAPAAVATAPAPAAPVAPPATARPAGAQHLYTSHARQALTQDSVLAVANASAEHPEAPSADSLARLRLAAQEITGVGRRVTSLDAMVLRDAQQYLTALEQHGARSTAAASAATTLAKSLARSAGLERCETCGQFKSPDKPHVCRYGAGDLAGAEAAAAQRARQGATVAAQVAETAPAADAAPAAMPSAAAAAQATAATTAMFAQMEAFMARMNTLVGTVNESLLQAQQAQALAMAAASAAGAGYSGAAGPAAALPPAPALDQAAIAAQVQAEIQRQIALAFAMQPPAQSGAAPAAQPEPAATGPAATAPEPEPGPRLPVGTWQAYDPKGRRNWFEARMAEVAAMPEPDFYLDAVPKEYGGQLSAPELGSCERSNPHYVKTQELDEAAQTMAASLRDAMIAHRYGGEAPMEMRTFAVSGPPGTGKSYICQQLAAALTWEDKTGVRRQGVPYTEITVPAKSTAEELIGGTGIRGGNTVANLGPIGRALARGGVVQIAEAANSPDVFLALNQALQDGEFLVPAGDAGTRTIKVHPSTVVIFTWNPGTAPAGSVGGTYGMPASTESRTNHFNLQPPSIGDLGAWLIAQHRSFADSAPGKLEHLVPAQVEAEAVARFHTAVMQAAQDDKLAMDKDPNLGPRLMATFWRNSRTHGFLKAAQMTYGTMCCDEGQAGEGQRALVMQACISVFGQDGKRIYRGTQAPNQTP